MRFTLFATLLATSVPLVCHADTGRCFKVLLKEAVKPSCAPAKSQVTEVVCGDPAEVLHEFGVIEATIDCSSQPHRLSLDVDGGKIRAELAAVDLWGGINYRAVGALWEGPVALMGADEQAKPKRTSAIPRIERSAAPVSTAVPRREVASLGPVHPQQSVPIEARGSEEPSTATGVETKVSGFAWVESEDTRNFGYDGASAVPLFDRASPTSHQSPTTFMVNLQLDVKKGPSQLTGIFEIGEVLAGDPPSGGGQGARQKILEIKNVFLDQELNPDWRLKAGLLPHVSDPNGYVFADHAFGAQLEGSLRFGGLSLWTAKAYDNRSGLNTDPAVAGTDQYGGFQLQNVWGPAVKSTVFGATRRFDDRMYDDVSASFVDGISKSMWGGLTFDVSVNDAWGLQATGVSFGNRFASETAEGSSAGRLFDVRLTAAFKESGWEWGLERLDTSKFSAGGVPYLLTLATSDGADDAPGTAKESVLIPISTPEGLRVSVLRIKKVFSEKWSGFVRCGRLQSSLESPTGSVELGSECDLEAVYEVSPGTTLQFDVAEFRPGEFYVNRDAVRDAVEVRILGGPWTISNWS